MNNYFKNLIILLGIVITVFGCQSGCNEIVLKEKSLIIYVNNPKSIAGEINSTDKKFVFSDDFLSLIKPEKNLDELDTADIYKTIIVRLSNKPNSEESQTLFTFDFSKSAGLKNNYFGYVTAVETFFEGDANGRYNDYVKARFDGGSSNKLNAKDYKNKKGIFVYKESGEQFGNNESGDSDGVLTSIEELNEKIQDHITHNGKKVTILFDYPIEQENQLLNYKSKKTELKKKIQTCESALESKERSKKKSEIQNSLNKLKKNLSEIPDESFDDFFETLRLAEDKIENLRAKIENLKNKQVIVDTTLIKDQSQKTKLSISVNKPRFDTKTNGIRWSYTNSNTNRPLNLDLLPKDLQITATVIADGNVYNNYKLRYNEVSFAEESSRFWNSTNHNLKDLKKYTRIKVVLSFYSASMNISEKHEGQYSVYCKNSGNCVLYPFK